MNTHPSGVLLQALEDGEVGERRRTALRSHIDGCAECRDRLEELRDLSRGFSMALARLDTAGEMALARLAAAAPGTGLTAKVQPVPERRWLKAALIAGLMVATGSVAGLSALWLRDRLAGPEPVPAVTTTTAAPETPEFTSGITVTPTTSELDIRITGLAAESVVELRLVDGAQVQVDVAPEAGTPARYSDAVAGRIDIAVSGRAHVIVSLPRSLAVATVSVDGRVRATKRGGGDLDIPTSGSDVTVRAAEG